MIAVAEALTLLLNLLVACAACAGAIAAFMGLRTWKDQSKWERDSKLARDILLNLRKREDDFRSLRHRLVSAGEQHNASKGILDLSKQVDRDTAYSAAIIARINKAEESWPSFYALIIEADAIWATSLEKSLENMRSVETSVYFAHEQLLKVNQCPDRDFDEREERVRLRKKAFGSKGDEFDLKYTDASLPISEKAKLMLDRR